MCYEDCGDGRGPNEGRKGKVGVDGAFWCRDDRQEQQEQETTCYNKIHDGGLAWSSAGLFGDVYDDTYTLDECSNKCKTISGAVGFQYGASSGTRAGDCICAQGLTDTGTNANWEVYENKSDCS